MKVVVEGGARVSDEESDEAKDGTPWLIAIQRLLLVCDLQDFHCKSRRRVRRHRVQERLHAEGAYELSNGRQTQKCFSHKAGGASRAEREAVNGVMSSGE